MQKVLLLCGILLCSLMTTGKAEAPKSTIEEVVRHYPDSKVKVIKAILAEAKVQGVQPEIALSIAEVESSFNPNVFRFEPKFKTYSVGLFQMFVPTARAMGFKGKAMGLMNPRVNIKLGIRYIKQCVEKYGYDVDRIACCHNAGLYAKDSVCKNNAWVQDYVEKINTSYSRWKI